MCDYSLQHTLSRDAKVGDKLETRSFGYTTGLCDPSDKHVAVCLRPGTEVAFTEPPQKWSFLSSILSTAKTEHKVAVFKQINKDDPHIHHDAFEMPDGQTILINNMKEGQTVTVLQLPATPKSTEEAKEQERLAVVA